MSILFEIEPFGKPEAARKRFNETLQRARAGWIAGHPVFDWVHEAAVSRPTLAYDLHTIGERMLWLSESASTCSIAPLIAVKSCICENYLELAHRFLDGFDVSNLNEYSALPENLQGKLVSLTTPVLSGELDAFRAKGNELLVTLDSKVQLEQFFSQPETCSYVLRVRGPDLLRCAEPPDPAFYPVTRFGFSVEEIRELLRDPRLQSRPPAGFHVHHGSEVNRLSTFTRMLDSLADLARTLNGAVTFLNMGGGWHRLTRPEIVDVMSVARRLFPQPCRILLEPGRWYADSAGYAVGRVVNLSRDRDIIRCTLDLSARCHLHWSSPTLLQFADPGCDRGGIVQFYGASCYESDLIGKYMVPCSGDLLPDAGLVPGSQVVFGSVSTYSAAWNTSFNGIPKADVEWIDLGSRAGQ